MDDKLKVLLNIFNKQLELAQDTRSKIMKHLQERYGIDTDHEQETIEDSFDFCYGIYEPGIQKMIDKIEFQERKF